MPKTTEMCFDFSRNEHQVHFINLCRLDQSNLFHKAQKRGTANKTFTARTQHVTIRTKHVKSRSNFHSLSQGQWHSTI